MRAATRSGSRLGVVDDREPPHRRRIVREVQAGAEADLEDVAARRRARSRARSRVGTSPASDHSMIRGKTCRA